MAAIERKIEEKICNESYYEDKLVLEWGQGEIVEEQHILLIEAQIIKKYDTLEIQLAGSK